jgi:hypothetical protein
MVRAGSYAAYNRTQESERWTKYPGWRRSRDAGACERIEERLSTRSALDRYLASPNTVESRWLVLRVLGLAACAILIDRAIPQGIGNGRHLFALLGVLIARD